MLTDLLWPCLIVLFSLLLCLGLSLARVVFGIIANNFDPTRDTAPNYLRIKEIWELSPTQEVFSLGRLICNSTAGILVFLYLQHSFAPTGHLYADALLHLMGVLALLHLVSGFAPTLLGNLRPYTMATFSLIIFSFARALLGPLARASRGITEGTLRALGYDSRLSFLTDGQREILDADKHAQNENHLEEEERQMILNIFDFAETPVREIMTPRVDMTSLELGTPLEEVIRHLNKERHSRIPVYRDTIDTIVGILHNRDFLHWYTERFHDEPFQLQNLLKPPFFVPYHKKIDDLLRELRRAGAQLAIVVDEFGGTAGLVTIEDILEEIVGEIRDEDDFDEEHPIQRLNNSKFMVNPIISLGDLEDEIDVPVEVPPDSHVETLGGLIQATLGFLPQVGTEVKIGTFTVKILKLDGVRMEKVLLTLPEPSSKSRGKKEKNKGMDNTPP